MTLSTPAGGRIRYGISMMGMGLLACLGLAPAASAAEGKDGTLEKLIVASGRVALDLDMQKLGGGPARFDAPACPVSSGTDIWPVQPAVDDCGCPCWSWPRM